LHAYNNNVKTSNLKDLNNKIILTAKENKRDENDYYNSLKNWAKNKN